MFHYGSQNDNSSHNPGEGFTPISPLISGDSGVIRFPLLFIRKKSVRMEFEKISLLLHSFVH